MWQKFFSLTLIWPCLQFSVFASPSNSHHLLISTGADVIASLPDEMKTQVKVLEKSSDVEVGLLEIPNDEATILKLSELIHQKFNRCGGFKVHEDLDEAKKAFITEKIASFNDFNLASFAPNPFIEKVIQDVDELKIRETITSLSQFRNRFYKAKTGTESQAYLFKKWSDLVADRSDIKIEYFTHKNFPQKSIILTITGTAHPHEIVILGGHADSISGYFDRNNSRAPGADDNASGIATITEALRIMVKNDYRPQRTIQLMAYAAEEVGLLGSDDIAKHYRQSAINVVSAMQLDMTGLKSGQWDLSLISDHTDSNLNAVTANLIDQYLPNIPWGYSKCGYACSDHASWHQQSYSATFPFESHADDHNGKIHTASDTLETIGSNAQHIVPFAQLATAYLIEMAK